MTRLKLAIGALLVLGCDGGFRRRSIGEEHPENIAAHGEAVLQLINRGGIGLENNVHIEAGVVLFVRDAGEAPLVHLLHGFNFAARRRDFAGNPVDNIFDAFFFGGSFQYEQPFVSFHWSFLSLPASSSMTTPLNWLMA